MSYYWKLINEILLKSKRFRHFLVEKVAGDTIDVPIPFQLKLVKIAKDPIKNDITWVIRNQNSTI